MRFLQIGPKFLRSNVNQAEKKRSEMISDPNICFEFDAKLPVQTILKIQLWDWDMTSANDMIAETKIDLENRWFSRHRATCGLPKRYDSVGYNSWRDTKKPATILNGLCRVANIALPVYTSDFKSLAIHDKRFDCDKEVWEFASKQSSAQELSYRKVHHESPTEYIKQNTALAALHKWSEIDPKGALVSEHIEIRSIFNPQWPDIEQGKLEMWLDFFPASRPPVGPPIDIIPPKPIKYELRVIIFNTEDVELSDENILTGEKMSDIYVKGWILGDKLDGQDTETHYRSLTGEGNFNWRFIFNFDYLDIEDKIVYDAKDSVFQVGSVLKKIPPRLVLRVYDADLISDDFLGECILDLTNIPLGAKSSKACKGTMLTEPHKGIRRNLFETKRIAGEFCLRN
ncbi:unnamed protein product [Didymodactylos carnosus]|nr:unnamed protein product [Didymodactylos carnosus]CAF4364537.1 unnamed protein product [Didymodactylos carnosus]